MPFSRAYSALKAREDAERRTVRRDVALELVKKRVYELIQFYAQRLGRTHMMYRVPVFVEDAPLFDRKQMVIALIDELRSEGYVVSRWGTDRIHIDWSA